MTIPDAPGRKTYVEADFTDPSAGPCDLILEGGVASGVVHPNVVFELARKHRLNAIGATSAGANAGVLAAAAEYARTVRGDPGGFVRMQTICDARAGALGDLFQEEPGFEPLMAVLKGRGGLASRLFTAFRGPILWGALAGFAGGLALAYAGGPGPAPGAFGNQNPIPVLMGLARFAIGLGGAALGGIVATGIVAARLAVRFNAHLGICTGLTRPGAEVAAITDWLHESIQQIAFGPAPGKVLTFGDLEGPGAPPVKLRLIASNLSQQKPHTLPETWPEGRYRPAEWAELFPRAILDHLQACTRDTGGGTRSLPAREDLPILVASRMSMSVPGLFRPVPVELADVETARRVRRLSGLPPSSDDLRPAWRRVLFSDGGSTSNFPIHLFDAPLPDWPTYAIDFEDLPPGAEGVGRVVILDEAGEPRIRPIGSAAAYFGALFATSQNWNDVLLSLLPIHRDRIARVHLAAGQGGLNLNMTQDEVLTMMAYGQEAGARLAQTAFPAHQARRTEALYANLVDVARQSQAVWDRGGLGAKFRDGDLPAPHLTPADRSRIAEAVDRLTAIASLPRSRPTGAASPSGQARITPKY